MNSLKFSMMAAAAVVLSAPLGPVAASAQQNTTGMPTVPIEAWALRDVVSSVQVSPDGKHVLVVSRDSKLGDNFLDIYKVEDMSKPFKRLAADPMEIVSASWISDNQIIGTTWKVIRKSVKYQEQDVRGYKVYVYNLEKNKFTEADGNYDIVNRLPNDPDHVLISQARRNDGGTGVDPLEFIRPRAYYKFNVESGTRALVYKGSEKYPSAIFDDDGNPRFTSSIDQATKELRFYYRGANDGDWTQMDQTYDLDEHENIYTVYSGFQGFQGFNAEDPTKGYFITTNGEDKAGLYEFDFNTGKLGAKLYSNENADIIGLQRHSMARSGNTSLVAAVFPGEKYERAWFDETELALHQTLEASIPNAHQVSITSRSDDGKTMIVSNSGPRDPGSYWLVKDGRMSKLGSRNPLLTPNELSDVEYIQYKSRDGRTIPAYVTKPKGEGPFPLVVMPHGGPHVNEVVGFDEWGQLLANAGYMVLQPQYRISTGWGKEHFDAGYGEHGGKMQDDKDDGAMYLVQQGLVDPDRMAMFGWSYGGYAALVAAQRDENIYQCAIAGAAVANSERWYKETRSPYSPQAFDDWSKRRGTIGVDPVKTAEKTNIPLLMVHGDVDRRVMYYHYEDYKKAMEKAGKTNAQYLTLEGADHFSNTLMYDHQELFYTKMLDFLKNDCGPGGL
ncbi:prolyl oligopeptidase family serine peptidase [Qipengyuania psychrotolerans]|uniref:Prolyl oligopeptidase family serine peptidase n=2 Tax=Qipengyuania psychrotolerans TaxID=2867238 RepID=A0ABX8ZE18_9SPHN|nr:prolyl oligopeptidase family serine peptidase [Qipengyuania psychrotolerans]